ncbi:MAG: hypothetical protein REI78_05555 [Pedobacter sp.]|nr:hypothetical protein [Pedobacter sp.]
MNTIEEQIWDYLDGTLDATTHAAIAAKIANDPDYGSCYRELLKLHEQLGDLALEAPSLSFARNVMEEVSAVPAPVALKTKIDKRIVYAIGFLFTAMIVGIFAYAITMNKDTFQMPEIKWSNFTQQIGNPVYLTIFVLIDVALGLLYLDGYLRRKLN